jgi:ketosteroid isomerase-like protein
MSCASSWSGVTAATVILVNIRRVIRDGLVVEYHDATLSVGGRVAVVDVALIVEFNDEGKATSINEYLDSAALATLMK